MASGDFTASTGTHTPRKRVKRDNESEEIPETDTENALEEMIVCQSELDNLAERSAVEILNIERQYNEQRKPLYDKRAEKIGKVPNFWLRVLASHPDTKGLLVKEQLRCLHFLTKIEVEDAEDVESGYWIRFHFSPNTYFENEVLVKEFRWAPGVVTSTSTEIKWKEGMNLLERSGEDSKESVVRSGRTFFEWFYDHSDPQKDKIAATIKEEIWTNPLEYCAVHSDEEDEDEDETDDEDDEDSEEVDAVRVDDGDEYQSDEPCLWDDYESDARKQQEAEETGLIEKPEIDPTVHHVTKMPDGK